MTRIAELAQRDSILGPTFAPPIIGQPVSLIQRGDVPRRFVGTVVDTSADRKSVWVRELHHDAETMTVYGVHELDLANRDELATVGLYYLSQRTDETRKLMRDARKETPA